MFSWMTKCCSTSSSCPFESALDNCTYADWNAPVETSLQYVLQCMRGQHKEVIRAQKAFSIFKTKFEKHEQKNNAAFRLKNLLLLDRCTEEKCILDMIATYEYNRLFYDRNKADTSAQNKFIQQLICAYYLYIKKKGDIYQRFPDELFDCKTRKSYLSNANNLGRIFEFIDNALQIQKHLNQVNETLKKVNRSPLLIQQILTYMLKTYIFLYTIVAISLQTLLGRLKSLKILELNNLERLLKYFSRDYTNAFLSFLEINKTVPAFKNIQYNEIIKIDPAYMSIFDRFYKIKVTEMTNLISEEIGSQKNLSSTPTTAKSSLIDSQQFEKSVLELPDDVFGKITEQLKFFHPPRKVIIQIPSSDDHIFAMAFLQYNNYYSQKFIEDNNPQNIRESSNVQQPGQLVPLKKKSSRLAKKKSIMEDLINSKLIRKKTMKEKLITRDFNEKKWIVWQNIYSQD